MITGPEPKRAQQRRKFTLDIYKKLAKSRKITERFKQKSAEFSEFFYFHLKKFLCSFLTVTISKVGKLHFLDTMYNFF
jgi:hypothetical protein